MPDYGHDLQFGANLLPFARHADEVVALAQLSEQSGMDLVTFQDHPYHQEFLDTWTLLSHVAARTSTVRLAADVHPVPLRPPAVLARGAASLDILSGGRLELGLGAGGRWEAIESMGVQRLSPGQAVTALDEAIQVIRASWDTGTQEGIRISGQHYQLNGVKPGPRPAHDIRIWLGAYKPRMLRLTGRAADGWLPSLPAMEEHGGIRLADGNAAIDEAAAAAGRSPRDVRRLLNLGGELPVDQLTDLALADGISTFILLTRDPDQIRRFAGETAPAVRELVAKERAAGGR